MRRNLKFLYIIGAFLICSAAHAQTAEQRESKLQFYNLGVEQLRQIENPNEVDLESAFSAAASLGIEQVEKLIADFNIKPVEIVRNTLQNASHFKDLELTYKNLNAEDIFDGYHAIPVYFTKELAARRQLIDRLIEQTDGYLRADFTNPTKNVTEDRYKRRVEELHFIYNQTLLQSATAPDSVETYFIGVTDQQLRDYLLWRVISKFGLRLAEPDQLFEYANQIECPALRVHAIETLILSIPKSNIDSEVARKLLRFAARLRLSNLDSQPRDFESDFSVLWRCSLPQPEEFSSSKLSYFEYAELLNLKKHVPNLYGDLVAAKLIEETQPSANPKPQDNAGKRKAQTPIETGFTKKLSEVPAAQQPRWIAYFVIEFGWQHRSIEVGKFPDSELILEAFERCHDRSEVIGTELNTCIHSFTPPTPAAKQLLYRMMKRLPESKQHATEVEIEILAKEIQSASPSQLDEIFARCEKLISIAKSREMVEKSVSRLAPTFAEHGNKEYAIRLIEKVKWPELKARTLFECSMAVPPQSRVGERIPIRSNVDEFDGRGGGGIF